MKILSKTRIAVIFALTFLYAGILYGHDVSGTVYADFPDYSQTDLFQRYSGHDFGLPDINVDLFSQNGDKLSATTDENGDYIFSDVNDGKYLMFAGTPEKAEACTTHNDVENLAKWFKTDSIKYVAFGDSTTVYGDPVPYPARLNKILREFFTVDFKNAGVSGSTTSDWMPGPGGYYDRNKNLFKAADLIVVSLGGNDLADGAENYSVEQAEAAMKQAEKNLETIINSLRLLNPDAVIVATVYPNYSLADTYWLQYVSSDWLGLIQAGMDGMIRDMRRYLSTNIPDLILADCYMSFKGLDMNDYMHDPIHPNGKGHQIYAETVFRALGGVVVSNNEVLSHDFGFRGDFEQKIPDQTIPDEAGPDTAEPVRPEELSMPDAVEPVQDIVATEEIRNNNDISTDDTALDNFSDNGVDNLKQPEISAADTLSSDTISLPPSLGGGGCSTTALPYPVSTGMIVLLILGLLFLKTQKQRY